MNKRPVSVIETPEFLSAARKLLDEEERKALVDFLAGSPEAGEVIQGSGGVRKLRWSLEGRGKRGGARVIYFFHDAGMPLFALTCYAKNAKTDLTQGEIHDLRRLTALIVNTFKRKRP